MVGLTLDEDGIPNTAEKRYEIAKKIVDKAISYGIKKEDIFIDCLSLTVSAGQDESMVTLECIKMVKENLGVKTILGVSNISFGLPNRKALNNLYLTLALNYGLDLPIINPNEESSMEVINSYKVIKNIDKACTNYIEKYSGYNNKKKIKVVDVDITLDKVIERGLKEEAKYSALSLLEKYDENHILDEILIPALDIVGKKYDSGEIFLPQLIQSAETVKVSLNVIKESLLKEDNNTISKGKIIVATVKGDIHDIGKNIVKIMLENYGYEVIDLGKDVPIEEVVHQAKSYNIKLVGLSALMTTTVNSMKETIKALRENEIDAKVFVGGAVLTEEYAKDLGADYYSKDAKSAVEIAKMNFL
ncbi:cobalamin-dependent protein [[Clostridium] dakarense]|uniref:cobalamin-dependent protein n=1 Tax=Faecalimicrobium dakarense TaxID=1301100 RepID=UPI0004B127F0|nr:cobalamin-dependent protein [[Clostridium] dakarense]